MTTLPPDTQGLTLTGFLLARIAEDEERLVHEWDCDRFTLYDYGARQGKCDCTATARLEADCKAKRRIVADHHPSGEYDTDSCVLCQWDIDCDAPKADYKDGAGEFPCPTLRYLAAVYVDHPDYREEWKP